MINLIPAPRRCALINESTHKITPAAYTACEEWVEHIAAFCDTFDRGHGVRLAVGATGGIELYRDAMLAKGEYRIETAGAARAFASDAEGACYALATIVQLCEVRGGEIFLPEVDVVDSPDKDYRAVMVDLGREWHPFSKLLKYVDLCYFYKVRYLNLHFADNKLYTLPSRAFPRLNEDGKHYTEEEIAYLCKYAAARGIILVPELECPGHAPILNKHYPEVFGDRTEGEGGIMRNESGEIIDNSALICAGRESAVEGVKTLIDEICELFHEAPYIHIGGDEANISLWELCADCREYMKKNGIKDVYGLYSDYVARIARHVLLRGKTPIVWEGFPEEGADRIPKETVVISWENHYQTTHQLLAEGFRIINSAWKPMYIVPVMITQTPPFNWGQREIFDWSVYNWQHWWEKSVATENPITVEPTEQVIGAMMCAWEMTFEQEIGQVMAHLAAMSERTWSTEYRRDFLAFRDAFRHCYDICARIIQDR